jgi:hypothetical protein
VKFVLAKGSTMSDINLSTAMWIPFSPRSKTSYERVIGNPTMQRSDSV